MSTEATDSTPAKVRRKKPMNLAMKYYMEKKRAHDEFIEKERSEFELGKRHLANMMGDKSAEEMSQEDIDKAIEYLFPAGLYERAANPLMKPPEEVFPKQKDAEFDAEGRPYNPFFYTAAPQTTTLLHDIATHVDQVHAFADRMYGEGKKPDPDLMLDNQVLARSRWVTREELQKMFLEHVKEHQYNEVIKVFDRLATHPFSYRFKEFIYKYRVDNAHIKSTTEFLQPQFDERGNAYVEMMGQRKTACAKVRVTKPGTGKFSLIHIDHPDHLDDITYFFSLRDRMQVFYPLQFTRLLNLVDVSVTVDAGGSSSQAGAIRYALSVCLKSFVDKDMIEEMTVAGLLTQDVRVRERKKFGQKGARAKYTWKKR